MNCEACFCQVPVSNTDADQTRAHSSRALRPHFSFPCRSPVVANPYRHQTRARLDRLRDSLPPWASPTEGGVAVDFQGVPSWPMACRPDTVYRSSKTTLKRSHKNLGFQKRCQRLDWSVALPSLQILDAASPPGPITFCCPRLLASSWSPKAN